MNFLHEPWALLFGLITLALLAWPFYPTWREWRHPSDDQPLEIKNPAHAVRADAPAQPTGQASAHAPKLLLANGPGQRQLLMHLPHARPWGDQGWRVQGDCHLPDDSCLPGPLVVTGQLRCGARSLVERDVQVHGDAHLAPGSVILGALFAHQVTLAEGAQVLGPVVARAAVQLGPHAAIGHPGQPASLSALQLLADDSARVHGPVWTHAQGARP